MERNVFGEGGATSRTDLTVLREGLADELAPYISYVISKTIHPITHKIPAQPWEIPGCRALGSTRVTLGRSYVARITPDIFTLRRSLTPLEALTLTSQIRYPSKNRVSVPDIVTYYSQRYNRYHTVETKGPLVHKYLASRPELEAPDHNNPYSLFGVVDPVGCQYVAYKLLRGEIRDGVGKEVPTIYELVRHWPSAGAKTADTPRRVIMQRLRSSMFKLCAEDMLQELVNRGLVTSENILLLYSAAASDISASKLLFAKEMAEKRKRGLSVDVATLFPLSHKVTGYEEDTEEFASRALLPGGAIGVFAPELLQHIGVYIRNISATTRNGVDVDSMINTLKNMYCYCCHSLLHAAHTYPTGSVDPKSTHFLEMKAMAPVFQTGLRQVQKRRGLGVDERTVELFLGEKRDIELRNEVMEVIKAVPKETLYGQYLRAAMRYLDVWYVPMTRRLYHLVLSNPALFDVASSQFGRNTIQGVPTVDDFREELAEYRAVIKRRKSTDYKVRYHKDGSWRS